MKSSSKCSGSSGPPNERPYWNETGDGRRGTGPGLGDGEHLPFLVPELSDRFTCYSMSLLLPQDQVHLSAACRLNPSRRARQAVHSSHTR